MSNSKNIGQVSGLYISTTAPENTALIWYDSTPNQACHKVYDTTTNNWVALNPQIVSNTTYSELVNNASRNGLVIGKFYCITDRNNTLAIAITMTKVQYTDALGTLIVDDLGSNKIYTITSGNLLIDDILGVYDTITNKIVYSFTEASSLTSDDFVLGKRRINSRWELFKFKLSKLISSNANNSITWANGLYFSFSTALRNIVDRNDGVVSYNTYQSDKAIIEHNIDIISQQNQDILQRTLDDVTDKTTSEAVYDKQLPITPTDGTPTDIVFGDKLKTIVEKIQRWIKKLRFANGISISNDFTDAATKQYINTNDTVESALGKIHYFLKNITTATNLPSDWSIKSDDNPDRDAYEDDGSPKANDTLSIAFSKLTAFIKKVGKYGKLSFRNTDYHYDYSTDVPLPQSGDTIDTAFFKATEKFKQFGEVKDGIIRYGNNLISLKNGTVKLGRIGVNEDVFSAGTDIQISADGHFRLGKNTVNSTIISNTRQGTVIIRPTAKAESLEDLNTWEDDIDGVGVKIKADCIGAGLVVENENINSPYDAILNRVQVSGLFRKIRTVLGNYTVNVNEDATLLVYGNSTSGPNNVITLPDLNYSTQGVSIIVITHTFDGKTFTITTSGGGDVIHPGQGTVASIIPLVQNSMYILTGYLLQNTTYWTYMKNY